MQHPWWPTAVVYQIYPRSFADADGDGTGDLRGIARRLDHLADLGVDALWISPFYPSPMRDFGYDIADHTGVHPLFGDLDAFDALVAAAHERDLRVIVDFVPNHTSSDHPWFREARAARDSARRDFYTWADPKPDGSPPNNWLSIWGGPAWEWDAATGQYYLHVFLPEMPDLNWRNPAVRAAQFGVARFWLDRGVDGFRVDVALIVAKDPELRDNPLAPAGTVNVHKPFGAWDTQLHVNDHAHVDGHRWWREFRALLDAAAPPERVSMAEIHLFDPVEWAAWYGEANDEFHLPFNFSLLKTPWEAPSIAGAVQAIEAALPPGAWPTWVLGNHDEPRVASRLGPEGAPVAMMLLLTLRGTPTLYYGDELGLPDSVVPAELMRDPQGRVAPELSRDPARGPMPWQAEPDGGWTRPWLPLAPDAAARSVAAQREDPSSMLALTRALLAARRASPALARGDWAAVAAGEGVLAYHRQAGEDERLVALNLSGEPRRLPVPGAWALEVSTRTGVLAGAGPAAGGADAFADEVELAPHEGVLLRPA